MFFLAAKGNASANGTGLLSNQSYINGSFINGSYGNESYMESSINETFLVEFNTTINGSQG